MNNFIYESYLPDLTLCDKLVHWFENDNWAIRSQCPGQSTLGIDEETKKSTDISIYAVDFHRAPLITEYFDELYKIVQKYITLYPYAADTVKFGICESANVQRYLPGEGYYKWHSERGRGDYPINNRHLVYMTYLNDVEEGGGTEFLYQEHSTTAKKGKTLIWPVDWTHTHRGIVAPKETKYIITGWLSFYPLSYTM